MPWLMPGIGAQGGDLKKSIEIEKKGNGLSLVNVSRGIIYSGDGSIKEINKAANNYTKKIRDIL